MSEATPSELDPRIAVGAAAIVDIWMGGHQNWRHRLDESEFLESADWAQALRLSAAVLNATK